MNANEMERLVPTKGWLRSVVDDSKRSAPPGMTIVDYLHGKLTDRARALLEAEEESGAEPIGYVDRNAVAVLRDGGLYSGLVDSSPEPGRDIPIYASAPEPEPEAREERARLAIERAWKEDVTLRLHDIQHKLAPEPEPEEGEPDCREEIEAIKVNLVRLMEREIPPLKLARRRDEERIEALEKTQDNIIAVQKELVQGRSGSLVQARTPEPDSEPEPERPLVQGVSEEALALARKALDALERRKGEDIDEWAERLASDMVRPEPVGGDPSWDPWGMAQRDDASSESEPPDTLESLRRVAKKREPERDEDGENEYEMLRSYARAYSAYNRSEGGVEETRRLEELEDELAARLRSRPSEEAVRTAREAIGRTIDELDDIEEEHRGTDVGHAVVRVQEPLYKAIAALESFLRTKEGDDG